MQHIHVKMQNTLGNAIHAYVEMKYTQYVKMHQNTNVKMQQTHVLEPLQR